MIRCFIITTGEEVLSGQCVDTNASWISRQLIRAGVEIGQRITVGDRMDDLVRVFRDAARSADLVIVNGGLGPTVDDLTAAAAARALGVPLIRSESWEARLRQRFARMGRDMPPGNLKQADLPQGACLIDNELGTACGFTVESNRATMAFTPGVPAEMKRMLTQHILPAIQQRFALPSAAILKRLHSFGISEARMDQWLSALPKSPKICLGFRAHFPTLEIKLQGQAGEGDQPILTFLASLPDKVRDMVVAEDDQSLPMRLVEILASRGLTLSLAESCTGGLASSMLVDVPGSSRILKESMVVYADTAKTRQLGVPAETISRFGAVSMEVAMAMAHGALDRAGTDFALSITGIAGPEGGTPEKPVGTIAFAMVTPEFSAAQLLRLPNFGRKRLRSGAAMVAFDMLRRHLSDRAVFAPYDLATRLQALRLPR